MRTAKSHGGSNQWDFAVLILCCCLVIGRHHIGPIYRTTYKYVHHLTCMLHPCKKFMQYPPEPLDRYNFAVLPNDTVLYICATTPDLPVKDSFTFLDKLKEAYNRTNDLHAVVEESPGGEQSINMHNGNNESAPIVTVVPLDVNKACKVRKLSDVVKKTMKQYKKDRKKLKKSKKVSIPGHSKPKHTAEPAFLTPSSKKKYVPLLPGDNQGEYTIKSLHIQVEEVHGIAREGARKALIAREEKLDDLLERADELEAKAKDFQKTTCGMKRKMKWRNCSCFCCCID